MANIRYVNDSLIGEKFKPGLKFDFQLAIPVVECDEYALLIEHDGSNYANINSLYKLATEGKAPYCISIGVVPGILLTPNGTIRGMRMNSYDFFDCEYSDFIVYELIPFVIKKYQLRISNSADMHFVSGGSSGGISAFAIAWFHNEYFHRLYMSSPSFLSMGRGNEIPYLIRKYETKNLRIYQENSHDEPNEYFGWSKAIDEEALEAFKFAGYDFNFKCFDGEGHCSRYRDENEAYIRNEWIWREWQNQKIVALKNSHRIDCILPYNSKWEACEKLPDKHLYKVPDALANSFSNVVLSNDKQVWYLANENDDVIYMTLNNNEYSQILMHATLHTIPRFNPKGVIDMGIDFHDRLYVLTAIGIQCVRSFGLVDAILYLPDDTAPIAMVLSDALYVATKKGVYKRTLNQEAVTNNTHARRFIDYYD